MTTTTAGCAILLATISLPAHVDGTPLPAQVGATASTCREDEYRDPETGQCAVCVPCPQGLGSTVVECGNGFGAKGRCEPCEEGKTFQDQQLTTGSCRPCAYCDAYATVLSNCTSTQNTQCGPCQPGYGSHPDSSTFCSPCYLFNDNEKPTECLTTPAPTVTPSSSPPMQPTTNTTTSANGGSTVQNLPDTTNTYEITPVLNVTNSITSPGNELQPQLGFLAIPAVVIVLVLAIVLVVWLLRQRGRKNAPPKTATLAELEALNNPERDTTADAQNGVVHHSTQFSSTSADNGTSDHVVTIHHDGAQTGDPKIQSTGIHAVQEEHLGRPSNAVKNPLGPLIPTSPRGLQSSEPDNPRNGNSVVQDVLLASSAGPGENSANHVAPTLPSEEETQSSGPGIQGNGASLAREADSVDGNPLHLTCQESTDGDAADDNVEHQPTSESTNGDISPSTLPTIPEEMNSAQGRSSRPTFDRQDSNKKQGFLGQLSAKIPRPSFRRSTSCPAGQEESRVMSSPELVLDSKVREACSKVEKDIKEKDFKKDFDRACGFGKKMQWTDVDLGVRKTVAQMLTPNKSKQVLCCYLDLGEELGLDRQTQLKSCSDINEVFEVLDAQQVASITMEDVLLKLRKLKRVDVVRKLMEEILNKKRK